MTVQKIKELLDEYRKEIYGLESRRNNRDDTMSSIGFQDAVELLWPLVEGLEFYKNHADCKTMNIKCACRFCVGDDSYRYVFRDLEKKLGGEG